MADIIANVVFAIINWIIAKKKGFNPWQWVLALGFVGSIVVACLPSANANGIDEVKRQKRRNLGTTVGGALSILFIVILSISFFSWLLAVYVNKH
jgi:hypothetical protein